MNKIFAEKVLYIKLGKGGEYEKECIEEKSTIKLGYHGESHELCIQGKWDVLNNGMIKNHKEWSQNTATFHLNQIKMFYEEPKTTMWITFYNHKLWYCFAEEEIIYLEKESTDRGAPKERRTVDGWHDVDVKGKHLNILGLNGNLTKVQGFRGTICNINESEYLLRKINCEKSPEQIKLEKDLSQVQQDLIPLIKSLTPKDFEIFVDLIFRYAGWSRFGQVGDGIRDIDIQLVSPVTMERALVQVKSECSRKTFENVESTFSLLSKDYNQLYLVYHTPGSGLEKLLKQRDKKGIGTIMKIWDIQTLVELSLNAGLIDWLIKKTS